MRIQHVLTIAAALCAAAGAAAAAESSPAIPQTEFVTAGASMLPTFPIASTIVRVERIAFKDLRSGDVVIYRQAKVGNTTHRLFRKISARAWWAKGDNNRFPDRDYVTPENFLGRVIINAGTVTHSSEDQNDVSRRRR